MLFEQISKLLEVASYLPMPGPVQRREHVVQQFAEGYGHRSLVLLDRIAAPITPDAGVGNGYLLSTLQVPADLGHRRLCQPAATGHLSVRPLRVAL